MSEKVLREKVLTQLASFSPNQRRTEAVAKGEIRTKRVGQKLYVRFDHAGFNVTAIV